MTMQLLTVVGARPQFIKAAAVSRSIAATKGGDRPIVEQILHTGQHFDAAMSDQFFLNWAFLSPHFTFVSAEAAMGSTPAGCWSRSSGCFWVSAPTRYLCTATPTPSGWSSSCQQVEDPRDACEAGLRSFNRHQPEEQNRVLTDHLSELCFAPTDTAVGHLQREGIPAERIVRTGDVMADAARIFGK